MLNRRETYHLPVADTVMAPREGPITVTSVNQYNNLLHSKYLPLSPQIQVAPPFIKEASFVVDEDHFGTLQLVKTHKTDHGVSNPSDTFTTQSLHLTLVKHHGTGKYQKNCKIQRTKTSASGK
jgi:hypothetical protein